MKRILVLLAILFSVGVTEELVKLGAETYSNGDYQKAAELYDKACDGGSVIGCFNLGYLYEDGQGVKQNLSTAKKYFGKACDLGEQKGCDNYRILNERGIR